MIKTPCRVYLQTDVAEGVEITWCQDRINDNDTEYILASDYEQLKKQVEELREFETRVIDLLRSCQTTDERWCNLASYLERYVESYLQNKQLLQPREAQ